MRSAGASIPEPSDSAVVLSERATTPAHARSARQPSPLSPAEPLLLTVDETAALLRTTPKAVYAMIERAQIAGVTRLGRRVLIHRGELLEWLAERRAASPGRTRR